MRNPLTEGAVPEVDRLAVRVVTDSCHHAFEPSRTVGDVQLQRVGTVHLAPHAPEYLRQTAEAIKAINPDWLIPMHCSGEPFITIAQPVPGDKVLRSSTGTRFSFSAA